jgi:hypothetical protein
MPLTEAEYAFISRLTLEGFHDDRHTPLAWQNMRELGLLPGSSDKLFSFQYLWQEQRRIENRVSIWDLETGDLVSQPVVPCPWQDQDGFYRRWEVILPEIVAIAWETHHEAEILPTSPNCNNSLFGPVKIHPFLCTESEFLVAYYAEFKSHHFGPCFRQVSQADISHYDLLDLVNRYRNEVLHRGQHWPPPHSPDPLCPWPDNEFFTLRFDPELNPQLYYRNRTRPDLEPIYQSPADRFK